MRSYSVTTGAWIRGILAEDYGVDLSRIQWVTFEEAHVAEFRDPPNVQRAPAGKDINAMLLAGELDAAILGAIPQDGRLKPVIADPEAAGKKWGEKHGAIQLNHLVGVKNTVSKATADEVYALLLDSKKAAGRPADAAARAGGEPAQPGGRHRLRVQAEDDSAPLHGGRALRIASTAAA